MGYHVIKYMSDKFTLQEYITIDSQVSKYGELAIFATYVSEILSKNN